MADPPPSSRKLPFLSRSRPHWSRRSVIPGGEPPAPSPRSTTSLDSADRPSVNVDWTSSRPPPSSKVAYAAAGRGTGRPSGETHQEGSGGAGSASAGRSEASLVSHLIKRIVGRLPLHASTGALSVEDDAVVLQARRTLSDFAKGQLPVVLAPLMYEMDSLTKPPYYSPDTDFVSLDLLRSQLLLLRTLVDCTIHHWAAHLTQSATSNFGDPPPLDEPLAKQLITLASFFLKQHALHDDTSSLLSSSSLSVALLSQSALRAAASDSPNRGEATDLSTRSAVAQEIFRLAGRLIYFVSAANWNVVFARVRSRITHHANSDDPLDLSEVRILEWCCLDRRRLSAVIQELCNAFIHLKRPAQASLSVILRRAIWSWIEASGGEFAALTAAGRRLEGGPEVLFDIVFSLSESSKQKTFAWPVMTMLLACCPDILGKLVVGDGGRASGLTKKVQFFERLGKALKGAKLADVAAACYVDLVKAATYTQPNPDDPSALRLLVADLDSDLKSKLFDPARPFTTAEGAHDVGLSTEALVSLHRLDPASVIYAAFPALLAPEASESSKLTAVYACLVLVREPSQPAWIPPVSVLRAAVARPLRQLFLETISSEKDDNQAPTARRGPSKTSIRFTSAEEHSDRNELLRSILNVWCADLQFLTHDVRVPSTVEDGDNLSTVILAVVGLLGEPNHASGREAASRTLLALNQSDEHDVAGARDGVFEVSALAVSYGICKHVIESRNNPSEEREALELLLHDLMRYQALFQAPPSVQATNLISQPGWAGHWAAVEIPLLLCLCSSDSGSRALAILCFQRAAIILAEMEALDEGEHGSLVIREFAAEFAGRGGIILAPDVQQKQVRKVLAALRKPTPSLVAAWDDGMRRWKELSSVIFSRVTDEDLENGAAREQIESSKTPEQQFEEWSNLSGFLLAASGVCGPGCESLARLDSLVPPASLPAQFFRRVDRSKHIDRLVQELVDLLVSDSIKVRDAVKDALGLDLSQIQFPLFFKHLKSIVGHFFDNEKGTPVTEEAFTVFIVQTAAVLRLMFDRLSEPLSKPAMATIDSLLLSFSIYVQRLGASLQAYRLKIRLLQLCKVLLTKRGRAQQDSTFRNKLLENFVAWGSDVRAIVPDEGHERLRRDLDAACLKSLAPLLNGLVVHLTDTDSPTKHPETDRRLFSRYFDFFGHSLRKATQLERLPTAKHAALCKEYAIEALANLVNANVDPAFHRFTEMGTTPDIDLRTAYLQTLVKVVDKGTQFDSVAQLPEENTYAQLISLIRQPDLTLAMALCEVCSASNFEDLGEVFLKIFDTRKSVASFLKAVIEMEVNATDHESTLFRGNSFATKILTAYARARGYHYLRNTLKDLLLTLCEKPHAFSMDFDPHRETAADDAASKNLEQVTAAFLVCIGQSIDQVPPAIKEITQFIGVAVSKRFPESVFTAIGGFIFLRFINPAIVSPEVIDLVLPSDHRDVRRGLVMITKVLQALANNVRFGAKEPGLRVLNSFMDTKIFDMTRFLQSISHYAEEPLEVANEATREPPPGLDAAEQEFLFQFISDNTDKLGMELLQGKQSSGQVGARTWERVTTLVATLGPPPEAASRAAAARWDASPEQAYRAFMARNEARATVDGSSLWRRCFFPISGNNSGLPTFCILLDRIQAETADVESLLYCIFLQLASVQGPFEILVDCSAFASVNELPARWIQQLVSILPPATAQHAARFILLAPNTLFKRHVRKIGRLLSLDRLDSRRTLALSSISELELYFNNVDGLPLSLVTLSREKRAVFNRITERHQVKVEHPVVLKIGERTLVISTAKKQDLFSDVKCILDDTIDFSDVEEIRKLSLDGEGDGISIQILGEPAPRQFLVNTRRDELFTALVAAQHDVSSQLQVPRNTNLQPEDVSAVFINTILFNLCSTQDRLRASAHDLLGSLARAYALDGFEDPEACGGIYVPPAIGLLSSVSERLAGAAPSHSLSVIAHFAATLELATPSEAARYIHCLRPWLHNLHSLGHTPREERAAVQLKLRKFLRQLIKSAIREPTIHAILATRIWPAIGKLDFLLPLVLDETVRAVTAFDVGSDTDPIAKVSEIVVNLAAGSAFRGKLLARLRRVIARSAIQPVASLAQSPEWPEIAALVRLDLPLSFDSHLQAQLYLPDIFYVVVSLFSTGPLTIRQTLRGLVVNTVHSLARDNTGGVDSARLASVLSTLNGPSAELMFDLSKAAPSATDTWENAASAEELVRLLVEVCDAGAPSLDTANVWRARWTSLATANCFQHNPALQSRAFLVLSALGRQAHECDGDLVFQMLTTLRSAIRLSPSNDGFLAVTVVDCIAQTLPGLPSDSGFFGSSFWVGMALVQIGSPRVTAAAVGLLATVLDGLFDAGWFSDRTLADLLDFRNAEVSGPIDGLSGVNFNTSCSFSMATILVKGLRFSPIADETSTLLVKFLLAARNLDPTVAPVRAGLATHADDAVAHPRSLDRESTPIFLALLPYFARTGRMEELLDLAGLDDLAGAATTDPQKYAAIAARLSVEDADTATLAFGLLVAQARVADTDSEYLAIYTVMAQISHHFPSAANCLYDVAVPILNDLVDVCESPSVLDAAHSIIAALANHSLQDSKETDSALERLGFAALATGNAGSFALAELREVTALQVELADLTSTLIGDALANPQ